MKIEEINEKPDKIENVKQTKVETQKVLIGRIKPNRGHSLFEYNTITKKITLSNFDKPAEVSYIDALKGNISVNKSVTTKENCIYISALNKKNVIKILRREFALTGKELTANELKTGKDE